MTCARGDKPDHMSTGVPFSVLMSFYHRTDPEQLLEAVLSVADAQTLPPQQIVLVQDGPVANELIETVDKIRLQITMDLEVVVTPHNLGLGPALNIGLDHCKHDIVARMDADDVSLPARFAAQIPLITAGFDVVGTGIVEYDDASPGQVTVRTPMTNPDDVAAQMRLQQTVNHPTVMYRASKVLVCGGYPNFPNMEDYLLFARMAQANVRMTNVAQPLVKYRVSDGAYARRGGLAMLRTEIALQRIFLQNEFTTPAQCARNLLVRGCYRLIPEQLRKLLYRQIMAPRGTRFNPETPRG